MDGKDDEKKATGKEEGEKPKVDEKATDDGGSGGAPSEQDKRYEELLNSVAEMSKTISDMQRDMSMFVDAGGTINEGLTDNGDPAKTKEDDEIEYTPIDELNLF